MTLRVDLKCANLHKLAVCLPQSNPSLGDEPKVSNLRLGADAIQQEIRASAEKGQTQCIAVLCTQHESMRLVPTHHLREVVVTIFVASLLERPL